MAESRVKKSLLNAKVNLIFYFTFLGLSFFSRKIFLDCLGADFLGLTGTLGNILSFLSLAEMGVGTAVAFNLYKPLHDDDRSKVEEIVSVFGYLYRKIGLFICVGAVIISGCIPFIFKSTDFSLGIIFFAFFSILFSSLCSYFINYRQILLTADQKGYVVTAYLQGASFVKVLLQMLLAWYLKNYFVWITIEILFGVLSCIILNWKINKEYPWLHTSVSKGKRAYPQHAEIIKTTKQVFVHKMAAFVLNQSDQIMIFAFVSLKMVAYYGNYTMIATKIGQLFSSVLDSIGAGVGNLVAEGNHKKIMDIFWELLSIRFWIAGILVFGIYNLIEPFIILWLGEKYLLDHTVLLLLLASLFILQIRGVVDMYIAAYGMYSDTWAPITEAVINVSVTLVSAYYWGLSGILIGKIVSLLIIVMGWKPYYLFSSRLHEKLIMYWTGVLKYLLCFIASSGIVFLFKYYFITIDAGQSFSNWILYSIVLLLPYLVIYSLSLYLFCPGFRLAVYRVSFISKLKR